jgi:hypothetical protein
MHKTLKKEGLNVIETPSPMRIRGPPPGQLVLQVSVGMAGRKMPCVV